MGKDTQQKTTSRIDREFSAGGVVYKPGRDDLWLVTASMPSKLYPKAVWRFPKGWIDEKEKIEEAASREVREEGGVEARIIKKIGTEKYFFTTKEGKKILKFVTFYLMEWVRDLPEGFGDETSEVVWLPYNKAYERLTYSGEKEVLEKARNTLI